MIVKLLLLVLVMTRSECSDNDCFSGVVFLNRNFSTKESEENFTEARTQSIVEYDKWNQVIKDNKTIVEKILPHDVVPEISSHERGKGCEEVEKDSDTKTEEKD